MIWEQDNPISIFEMNLIVSLSDWNINDLGDDK